MFCEWVQKQVTTAPRQTKGAKTTMAAKITTKHHQIGIAYLQCITECTARTSSRHLWPPINTEGQKKFQGHYQQKTQKSSKSKNKKNLQCNTYKHHQTTRDHPKRNPSTIHQGGDDKTWFVQSWFRTMKQVKFLVDVKFPNSQISFYRALTRCFFFQQMSIFSLRFF